MQDVTDITGVFRSVRTAALIWLLVGVPVAAIIAAFAVFVWVIESLPEMLATAAILGSVQGLWFYLVGRSSTTKLQRFGIVSGALLGLLAFPPVFSRSNVVVSPLMLAIFFLAAITAGVAAGLVSARLAVVPVRANPSTGRGVIMGCLLLLLLAMIDYHFYWPATLDRFPVPSVSQTALRNLRPGNARSAAWTGCYQYLGRFSLGSGVVGKEGGLLKLEQLDGSIRIKDGDAHPLLGGIDSDGRFRAGAERAAGQDTLRVLWEGTVSTNSLTFTRRITVFRGQNAQNTTRLTGTGSRISCNL